MFDVRWREGGYSGLGIDETVLLKDVPEIRQVGVGELLIWQHCPWRLDPRLLSSSASEMAYRNFELLFNLELSISSDIPNLSLLCVPNECHSHPGLKAQLEPTLLAALPRLWPDHA